MIRRGPSRLDEAGRVAAGERRGSRRRPRPDRSGRAAPPPPSRRTPASRAIAAIAPAQRWARSAGTSAVNSSRRVIDPESVPCSSATAWASARPKRYGSREPYDTLSTHVTASPAARASSARSAIRRDLPIPASPSTTIVAAAAGREAIDDGPQAAPLRLPADEPSRSAAATAGTPPRRGAGRRGSGRVWPRSSCWPLVLDVEALARGVDGRLVEEDLAGLGDPLDPGGGRDRRPGQRPVERVVASGTRRRPRRSRSRSGPGAARPRPRRRRSRGHRLADRQRAVGGPQGVVVVALGPAEHREHRVADELLAGPVERLDRLDHRPERRVDLPPDVLGIVLGDEPDVVDEIGEEGGHDPPITRSTSSPGRVARSAPPVASSGAPHWSQNLADGRVGAPHAPHRTLASSPSAPLVDPPGRV